MKAVFKMRKMICLTLCCFLVCMAIPFNIFAEEEKSKLPYVIEPQYYSAEEFNKHGIARVQLAPAEEGGEEVFGVINLKGERIFGFDGTKFAIRKNGLIMAVGDNDKAAFFSSEGKQLTDYVYETFKRVQPKTPHFVTYHYLTDRYDGDGESDLVPICRDGKFGFINSKGEEAIAPTFDYVFGYYEGISRIGYDGVLSEYGTYTQCKFGYINENGEVLPTGELWAASDFSNGYAKIADGQHKVIDENGSEVKSPIGSYEFVETNGNFILVTDGSGLIVLDMNGNVLSGAETGHKSLFGKSFIIDRKQIADINGNIIYTAPEGVEIEYGRKNSYVTMINTSAVINRLSVIVKGLINQDGKVVLEPRHLGLREVADGIFADDGFDLYDINGDTIATTNGYNIGGNELSYNLLPLTDYDTNQRGYVELPKAANPYVSKFTESDIYKVYNIFDTDYGTVLYLQVVGAPHATGPFLMLVRENGEEVNLSERVSRETIWALPEHNDIKVSEDGRYITFNVSFEERSAGNIGASGTYTVLHDAGTYYYKANLETGVCIETRFEPHDTMGEDVISAWAKPEVEKAIDLGFVPIALWENYKRNITRAEFAKMAMDFLSFSYGYSNATRKKGWSEIDYEKYGYVNHDFLCAYCHAKPDRNGKSFMSGNAEYKYNSNLKITMAEPFEKTEDFLYYESVIAAYNIGIVNGVSETEFNPNGDITRQEAAAMLMRVYKNYGVCEEAPNDYLFADNVSIADWAKEDVYQINRLGVMQGVGNDMFAPLDNYTVEQAIATFLRLYEKAPVSRKNKNIAPLLEFKFEKEKLLEGNPAGRGWVTAEEKESIFDDYTILQGAWNMRHYGGSDVIYAFYKSGGVTTLFSGQLTSEVEIDTEKNVIRYSAESSNTFLLYNQLCGSEKVYEAGEYMCEKDIETGNILSLIRIN